MRRLSEETATPKRDPSASVGMTKMPTSIESACHGYRATPVIPFMGGDLAISECLFCGQQFFEGGFVEDWDAEGLGFVEFGAGVRADDHVASFFADCAA